MDKRERRREVANRRAGLAIDHGRHVLALARFLDEAVPADRWVVIYDALDGEVRLDELVTAHPDPGHRYALTRTPDAGHRLSIHPFGSPTERHRYGFAQPRADSAVVADADIGAVLVPGLAFDRFGTRLGRGGGYYDRFLARLDPAVLRIGITGGWLADDLPVEPHDIAMTHLAGPDGVTPVEPVEASRPGGPGGPESSPSSG